MLINKKKQKKVLFLIPSKEKKTFSLWKLDVIRALQTDQRTKFDTDYVLLLSRIMIRNSAVYLI